MRNFWSACLVLTSVATAGLGRSIESIGEKTSFQFCFISEKTEKRSFRSRSRSLAASAVTETMLIAASIQISDRRQMGKFVLKKISLL